jgi:cell division protein FtsW
MDMKIDELDKAKRNFLLVLSFLVATGITMVYSSSYMYAKEEYGSSAYFFIRQIYFVLIGSILLLGISRTRFSFWMKHCETINILVLLLLVCTFIPGIGHTVKGANRWINLGGFTFQPGELIKFTLIPTSLIFFDNFNTLSLKEKIVKSIFLLVGLVLLLFQPDFGSFSICFLVLSFVCFMSSFPRKYFYGFLSTGLILIVGIIFTQAYRISRIMTFLDPWKNPKTSGFQIIQSYLAFANGSFFGQGLGNSNEKLFYLPESHNDFILSVIGEELGFIGVCVIVVLFMLLVYYGLKLATLIQNKVGMIIISTIMFTIGFQAFLNMGVVLGLLPTKGLNLPFISSGGSSLVANLMAIGLIFCVVRSERQSLLSASQNSMGSSHQQMYTTSNLSSL